jgi:hypothetical protein
MGDHEYSIAPPDPIATVHSSQNRERSDWVPMRRTLYSERREPAWSEPGAERLGSCAAPSAGRDNVDMLGVLLDVLRVECEPCGGPVATLPVLTSRALDG